MSDGAIVISVMVVYGFAMYLVGRSHGEEDGHVKAKVSQVPEEDLRAPSDDSQSIPSSVDSDEPSSMD